MCYFTTFFGFKKSFYSARFKFIFVSINFQFLKASVRDAFLVIMILSETLSSTMYMNLIIITLFPVALFTIQDRFVNIGVKKVLHVMARVYS